MPPRPRAKQKLLPCHKVGTGTVHELVGHDHTGHRLTNIFSWWDIVTEDELRKFIYLRPCGWLLTDIRGIEKRGLEHVRKCLRMSLSAFNVHLSGRLDCPRCGREIFVDLYTPATDGSGCAVSNTGRYCIQYWKDVVLDETSQQQFARANRMQKVRQQRAS
jgi:hypothetical protein